MRRSLYGVAGFTLIDTLVTIAILAVLMGIAVPALTDVTRAMRLGQGAREVERELQAARLKAVATNRAMRVRFNCPAAGQYRMVELIGTPGVPASADAVANRCSDATTAYPYPAIDSDPNTLPNHDGPVRRLPQTITFNTVQTVEFRPDGTAHVDLGTGNPWGDMPSTGISIIVQQPTNGFFTTKVVSVNGLGRIQIQ